MEKYATIGYDETERLSEFANALSSPLRLCIMRELSGNSMSVKELAFRLNIPMSTASANVKILEEAGLIRTSYQSGKHGSLKLCSIRYERVSIEFAKPAETNIYRRYTVDMPIGGYFDFDISPTCGLVDEFKFIGKDDDIRAFYSPERFRAQLIWFTSGYLEYRFPLEFEYSSIRNLQISLECCSEAPGFRNEFPSDITFWLNGNEICEWTSPGDFGGVRGAYSPLWWPINSTQYGTLKKLTVTRSGSFLDDVFVSSVNLKTLDIEHQNCVIFRIGVKPTAKNVGGINLFGKKFGNYSQNIFMTIEYESNREGNDQ